MKHSSIKNKICLFLAITLSSISNIIAFSGSLALWGEPDPPKDLLK